MNEANDMRRRQLAALIILSISPVFTLIILFPRPSPAVLVGEVHDADGPIVNAVVRYKGDAHSTRSDVWGRFQLPQRDTRSRFVVASKPGFKIAGTPADTSLPRLTLHRLPSEDNENYAWVDPFPDPANRQSCGNCHGEIFNEWANSGHARAANNRRFLNLVNGTDWQGRKDVGWSLRADHPEGASVCTACHAPTVTSFNDPAYHDLRQARGVDAAGVHCDYCHKVSGVEDDQKLGQTHGRFGLKLLRPSEGQLFFGPLDDVDRGEDAFSPLYNNSRYCASCHEGVIFGVHVYSTYSEWLQSPARAEGKQCQHCHMAPTGKLTNIAPGKGGIRRDPKTLASHGLFADSQEEMLRRSLKVKASFVRDGTENRATVEVCAVDVGHRVPTGFIDRNLMLVVDGLDRERVITAWNGPSLPEFAGPELWGKGGKLFAKQLKDADGLSPTPFWRAPDETVDTRLLPGKPEIAAFLYPPNVDRLRVRLIYHRFWPNVARSKGWPDDAITVFDQTINLP